MKKVVFAAYKNIEQIEFEGVDGEIYTVSPGSVVVLPEIHARNLHKKVGEIILDFEPPEYEFWEEYQRRQLDLESDLYVDPDDIDGLDVQTWAKLTLQSEFKKPQEERDLEKIVTLKILSRGNNPLSLLYKSKDTKTPSEQSLPPSDDKFPRFLDSSIFCSCEKCGNDCINDLTSTTLEIFKCTNNLIKPFYNICTKRNTDLLNIGSTHTVYQVHKAYKFYHPLQSPKSPTGLCSPIGNTVHPHYSGGSIKDDNKYRTNKLRTALETYGLRCVTTLQAYRVKGLNELDLSGYSILDYGYTRVELHEEFARLLREFGYDLDRDFYLSLFFEEYRCPNHGSVFKPVMDWEMNCYRENGERKRNFRLMAGRLHPLKKYSDSKRYSALKLEQIRTIADFARKKAVSYRIFDGRLKRVRNSDLSLIWMVFTVPDHLSRGFSKVRNKKEVEQVMRKAVRSTLRRFLRKYLVKHENVKLGDFKLGGFMNLHLWSSSEPIKPHFHVHVCLWNIVLNEGEIVRFSPYFSPNWLEELKRLWMLELKKWIRKNPEVQIWTDHYFFDEHELFNIYTSYTRLNEENGELKEAGRITHHLRYNSRKPVIDINEFFYTGFKAEELEWHQREWLSFLIEYSNRTCNFGFMNCWRKYFPVSKDKVVEMLKRAKERHEYCPICKAKLEYVRLITLDQVVKRRRLLVLWYFDRKMNIEVWRGL